MWLPRHPEIPGHHGQCACGLQQILFTLLPHPTGAVFDYSFGFSVFGYGLSIWGSDRLGLKLTRDVSGLLNLNATPRSLLRGPVSESISVCVTFVSHLCRNSVALMCPGLRLGHSSSSCLCPCSGCLPSIMSVFITAAQPRTPSSADGQQKKKRGNLGTEK